MHNISPAAGAALMALAAGVSGVAAFYYARFRMMLPMRRRMAELERQAEHYAREMKAMHDVADTVAERSPQDQTTLGAVVTIAAKAVEADIAAALLLDETSGDLVSQPGAFGLSADQMYRVSRQDEASSTVRVFNTGKPFWSGDAQRDPLVLGHYAKLWKIHSLLTVPIRREGVCIGVLRMGSYKKNFFTQAHADLLTVIAEEAAVLVETAMLNRKLAETAEQLKALNRMKDDFVSTVSHEFKTPLTTIHGYASVMLAEEAGPLADQQKKFLSAMLNAVRRMNMLVTDLLDLSKLEAGAAMDLRPLPMATLLRDAVARHQPQIDGGARHVTLEAPEALPAVRGDARWLPLVLDNLVSNALKFTKEGGRITVMAEDRGELVVVSVADDGIGVPEADRERIFERFHRTANARESGAPGTGLGLAIVREVITRHGGKVWCEAGPGGKGTKISFLIPIARRLAEVA